jgi:hypothetical protein
MSRSQPPCAATNPPASILSSRSSLFAPASAASRSGLRQMPASAWLAVSFSASSRASYAKVARSRCDLASSSSGSACSGETKPGKSSSSIDIARLRRQRE